jgi:hypothetical protein
MDSPQKIDVVDWRDSPRPTVVKARALRRALSPTVFGILGTLLLHAMLIQSVSLVSQGPKPKAETPDSAIVPSKSTRGADDLVLVSLPTIAGANQPTSERAISSLPDLSKLKIKAPISVDPPEYLNLEALALSEDQTSTPIAKGEDGAELARLFGIYTGQIQARVDRVWRRPRTPVDEDSTDIAESFQCEAQIIQDVRGNVQEVLLPRCNGSPAWRNSLVLAIQHASPLPVPPSAKVFSTSISLSFVGLGYFAGALDDDYEPAPRIVLSTH